MFPFILISLCYTFVNSKMRDTHKEATRLLTHHFHLTTADWEGTLGSHFMEMLIFKMEATADQNQRLHAANWVAVPTEYIFMIESIDYYFFRSLLMDDGYFSSFVVNLRDTIFPPINTEIKEVKSW